MLVELDTSKLSDPGDALARGTGRSTDPASPPAAATVEHAPAWRAWKVAPVWRRKVLAASGWIRPATLDRAWRRRAGLSQCCPEMRAAVRPCPASIRSPCRGVVLTRSVRSLSMRWPASLQAIDPVHGR